MGALMLFERPTSSGSGSPRRSVGGRSSSSESDVLVAASNPMWVTRRTGGTDNRGTWNAHSITPGSSTAANTTHNDTSVVPTADQHSGSPTTHRDALRSDLPVVPQSGVIAAVITGTPTSSNSQPLRTDRLVLDSTASTVVVDSSLLSSTPAIIDPALVPIGPGSRLRSASLVPTQDSDGSLSPVPVPATVSGEPLETGSDASLLQPTGVAVVSSSTSPLTGHTNSDTSDGRATPTPGIRVAQANHGRASGETADNARQSGARANMSMSSSLLRSDKWSRNPRVSATGSAGGAARRASLSAGKQQEKSYILSKQYVRMEDTDSGATAGVRSVPTDTTGKDFVASKSISPASDSNAAVRSASGVVDHTPGRAHLILTPIASQLASGSIPQAAVVVEPPAE
jgi:hypothetical protein